MFVQPARRWWTALVVLSTHVAVCWTFSLDTGTAIIHSQLDRDSGAGDGEFGASVTFHQAGSTKGILVGAPAADYTNSSWKASGVSKPGVLYWCRWDRPNSCRQLPVDTTGEETATWNKDNQPRVVGTRKTAMRLGSSVVSVGPNKPAIVCADHYREVWYCVPLSKTYEARCLRNYNNNTLFDDPVGKCVVLPGSLQLDGDPDDINVGGSNYDLADPARLNDVESQWTALLPKGGTGYAYRYTGLLPLRTSMQGFNIQARPRPGAPPFPRTEITIGAPGSVLTSGQVWVSSISSTDQLSQLKQVSYYKRIASNSLGGYGATTGDFDGQATSDTYVALSRPTSVANETKPPSMFRIYGEIAIIKKSSAQADNTKFPPNDLIMVVFTGQQPSECFGCALLAVDLNNDTKEELIAGAPFYQGTSGESRTESAYDHGRVYIYSTTLQTALGQYKSSTIDVDSAPDVILEGAPMSRFGTSLALLGDLDKDGYQDIAIGAPLEPNGLHTGAVYIYMGSRQGITSQQYAQRIVPSELKTTTALFGFGFSIGFWWDIDDNNYNDLAIGSPFSGHAVVIRSRPVINIDYISLAVSEYVDAAKKNCVHKGTSYACFPARICSRYSIAIKPVEVAINVVLETNSELLVLSNMLTKVNQTLAMTMPLTDTCINITIAVQLGAKRLCEMSHVSVTSWKLLEPQSTAAKLTPILSRQQSNISLPQAQVSLLGDCSSCKPNLVTNILKITVNDEEKSSLVLGASRQLVVSAQVDNVGNRTSCQPSVTIESSHVLHATFIAFSPGWDCSDTGRTSISCSHSSGKLFPSESLAFEGTLNVANLNLTAVTIGYLDIITNSKSKNPEHTEVGNPSSKRLVITNEARLSISIESSSQVQEFVDMQDKILNQPQPTNVSHFPLNFVATFQVNNFGPSLGTTTNVLITFPWKTNSKAEYNYLYYLTAVDATVGNILCNHTGILNLLKLKGAQFEKPYQPVGSFSGSPVSQTPDTVPKNCVGKICSVSIQCQVQSSDLKPGQSAGIRFWWSVWTTTIQTEELVPVNMTLLFNFLNYSKASGFTLLQPYPVAVNETTLFRQATQKEESASVGPIIGAIIGGISLLVIIILILWKCGFFKKKDMPDSADGGMYPVGDSKDPGRPPADEKGASDVGASTKV